MRSVAKVLKKMEGAVTYSEVLNMELSEFSDFVLELRIMDSAERFEQMRIDNHRNAVG